MDKSSYSSNSYNISDIRCKLYWMEALHLVLCRLVSSTHFDYVMVLNNSPLLSLQLSIQHLYIQLILSSLSNGNRNNNPLLEVLLFSWFDALEWYFFICASSFLVYRTSTFPDSWMAPQLHNLPVFKNYFHPDSLHSVPTTDLSWQIRIRVLPLLIHNLGYLVFLCSYYSTWNNLDLKFLHYRIYEQSIQAQVP